AQISAVIGFAGAGKSTMLAAARQAWEAQGYRVHGAALAGKAAEGLEESSGIPSSTLASWEHRWQAGRGALGGNDVLVIDEAGMVGSRQLARFVNEAEARGAKLVLVGDHEQLQAIGAGAPFRAIAERIGAVALSEIRRQTEGWQREASIAFATHRTGDGLALYAGHGAVQFHDNRDEARAALVRDYLADLEGSSGSRIALAHRRVDVASINADIRAGLQARGLLAKGEEEHTSLGRELVYQTNDGQRCFAPGDRIVLLENNRELKVKNGMLGTVESVEPDALQIRLDGRGQANAQRKAQLLSIPVKSYQAFDHGYATTIHKAQGATVDRAFVLASATMDRHLTYVAMTRHREGVQLYAGRDAFRDMTALAASMGRSGAKETTLDYVGDFAARRGLAEAFGIRSEIGLGPTRDIAAHREKVEPLVPALTHYSQSIDAVAREKARPVFERAMEAVRSVGRHVYADMDAVAARLGAAITDNGIETQLLATSVAGRPEQFGALRGASGLLGDNSERKAARHHARALGHHVAAAGLVWERRFEAARQSEAWMR
ncbi:AAA family ATPase, partial [Rhizobium sp. BK251]|uniref:AAA family ATPase n=1 Tax=Rhizobium sp. BK251 TaxID=2512125 RepID=UPI0014051845